MVDSHAIDDSIDICLGFFVNSSFVIETIDCKIEIVKPLQVAL